MLHRHIHIVLSRPWKIVISMFVLCFTVGILALHWKYSLRSYIMDFNKPEKVMLTSNIWLHRTSRNVVTVTDKEGMGLVYGRVVRVGFDKSGGESVFIAYEPFADNAMNGESMGMTNAQLVVTKIDVESGNVIPVSRDDKSVTPLLEPVGAFFGKVNSTRQP